MMSATRGMARGKKKGAAESARAKLTPAKYAKSIRKSGKSK